MTFRTRLFVTSAIVTALTLALATTLVSWNLRRTIGARIERTLVDEARLAAQMLTHRRAATAADLDREADAIGRVVSARVTFIRGDGVVVGDSEVPLDQLAAVDNHADRPEVQQARRAGIGIARRYSSTVNADMLYVAVPVSNPEAPDLAIARLALPLLEIRADLAAVWRAAGLAFGVGLGVALALSWIGSALLAQRVRAIAAVAERYAAGDLSQPARDYGDDEIGSVARVLDASVQELGRRVAELNSDRARMAAILGGMIEGVLVVDDSGRLQLVNDAARRILTLEAEWSGGHYLEIVRHPEIAAQLTAALNGAPTAASELILPREPAITLMARAAPVVAAGVNGAVLVLHDISDMRRADQIRRDFVANVSHELRTPLTSVRGYVEALMDENDGGPKAQQFLETIARHTGRMERLVRDLLRLARLEARQDLLDPAVIDTRSLFSAVIAELADIVGARRQEITVQVAEGAAQFVADRAKLHDALRNLVENASKHSPEAGRITLRSERRGSSIAVIVGDNGPGIPEADLPRVFERFYRVDKARARDGRDPGGTGLGLSIVKHIATLHGGTVEVSNRAQGGAEFTMTLPVLAGGATRTGGSASRTRS